MLPDLALRRFGPTRASRGPNGGVEALQYAAASFPGGSQVLRNFYKKTYCIQDPVSQIFGIPAFYRVAQALCKNAQIFAEVPETCGALFCLTHRIIATRGKRPPHARLPRRCSLQRKNHQSVKRKARWHASRASGRPNHRHGPTRPAWRSAPFKKRVGQFQNHRLTAFAPG